MSVYCQELYWLAVDVVERAELVFEESPPPAAGETYIAVNQQLRTGIYAMLGSAAKIRALVEGRRRWGGQSAIAHEVMVARCRALRRLLDGLDLGTILSAEVRNSLEHFDERIDETAERMIDGTTPLPLNMPFDLAIGDRGALQQLKGEGSRASTDASGSVTRFRLTIGRRFTYRGKKESYLSAGCPTGTYYTEGKILFAGGTMLQGVHVLPCTPIG